MLSKNHLYHLQGQVKNKTIIGLKSISNERFYTRYEVKNKTIIGLK